jgi:hypothetical protein
MSARSLIGGVLAVVVVAACGGTNEGDDATCLADAPATCPTTGVPSYATQIAPLINQYCVTECHNPSGSASDQKIATYAQISGKATDVFNQIYSCNMPYQPSPIPTTDERVTLLTWFVCGTPNN